LQRQEWKTGSQAMYDRSGAAMTLNDVVDLLFASRERIDFYWNFYVVVVVAMIGWLISLKKPLNLSMKVLVTVAYLIAASMNLAGLYGSYTFAEALRTDVLRMASTAPLPDTRHILERHSYLAQRTVAIIVHVVMGALILFAVWFARLSEGDARTTAAAGDEIVT
jgi:hypothetical protein